jgi:hypothetical protein
VRVHIINPSEVSFGTAVITPRWLYVLAAATPENFGIPSLVDETLAEVDPDNIKPGDIVGIGIHTANALRGYEIGKMARERAPRWCSRVCLWPLRGLGKSRSSSVNNTMNALAEKDNYPAPPKRP